MLRCCEDTKVVDEEGRSNKAPLFTFSLRTKGKDALHGESNMVRVALNSAFIINCNAKAHFVAQRLASHIEGPLEGALTVVQ